jgi:hypothetical protein
MAAASVADVIWRFNPTSGQIDIIHNGTVIESVTDASKAAQRLSFHRSQVARSSGGRFVEASPDKRRRGH